MPEVRLGLSLQSMLMFFAVRVFSGRALDQRTFWLAILLVSVPVVLIVSPGTTQELLDAAADSDVPLLPGAATASEVM